MESGIQKTNEIMTAGITNIPLTKPATPFFILDTHDTDKVNQVYILLENMKVEFTRTDYWQTGKTFIISKQEIDSSKIKNIFRNFRTLRPKLNSKWRYLFWEIDSIEEGELDKVLAVYRILKLPVYVHRSMMGYHFLCVKPILEELWKWAIIQLRPTNEKYPPLTLRIIPNKYVNEKEIFHEGFIISEVFHSDTKQLRDWIVSRNLFKIQEQYFLVWYSLEDAHKHREDSLKQREQLFNRQIEESN